MDRAALHPALLLPPPPWGHGPSTASAQPSDKFQRNEVTEALNPTAGQLRVISSQARPRAAESGDRVGGHTCPLSDFASCFGGDSAREAGTLGLS